MCFTIHTYLSLYVSPRLQTCKFFGGVFDGFGRAKQLVLRDEGRVGGVHPVIILQHLGGRGQVGDTLGDISRNDAQVRLGRPAGFR